MFWIENVLSLWNFAVLWGGVLVVDWLMQLTGLQQIYGVGMDGLVTPSACGFMGFFVALSYSYLFTGSKGNLQVRKDLFRQVNLAYMAVAFCSNFIDLMLRLFFFDTFYCQNIEMFAVCKHGYANHLLIDVFKMVCIARMWLYATEVLEKFST